MQSSGSEPSMGGTGDRTKDELKGGSGVGASKTDFFTERKVQHTTNSTQPNKIGNIRKLVLSEEKTEY